MTDDAFDLAELGDEPPPGSVQPPTRDHVTFRAAGAAPVAPLDAADDFARWLKADAKAHGSRIKARTHTSYSGAVTSRVYWSGGRFFTVGFKSLADGQLLARHNGAGGHPLSRLLHDWLTASDRFTNLCWRTRDQFRAGEPGQAAPA